MTPRNTLRTIEWLEERARQAPPNEMVYRQAVAELRWRLPDDHEQHPRKHGRLVRQAFAIEYRFASGEKD